MCLPQEFLSLVILGFFSCLLRQLIISDDFTVFSHCLKPQQISCHLSRKFKNVAENYYHTISSSKPNSWSKCQMKSSNKLIALNIHMNSKHDNNMGRKSTKNKNRKKNITCTILHEKNLNESLSGIQHKQDFDFICFH